MVVFEALRILNQRKLPAQVIFTGRESDHRNPGYFNLLKEYVEKYKLAEVTKFLGFIPREDQLGLMQEAYAVIQPSKFEGWGTVVEDAKALRRPVVLSDIPVHHEQMQSGAYFFPPDNAEALALLLADFLAPGFSPRLPEGNHEERLIDFAHNFLDIFDFKD